MPLEDFTFLIISLIILVFTYVICRHIGAENDFVIVLFLFGFACVAVNFFGYVSDVVMFIGILVIALIIYLEVRKRE